MRKFVVFACMAGLSLSVAARTPDGLTPAEENICDPLKSATAGLYGLCVSYCEARDIDDVLMSEDLDAKHALKLVQRQDKLLAKYEARRQPGDPDLPCLPKTDTCPCWSPEQTNASYWIAKTIASQCDGLDLPGAFYKEISGVDSAHPDYAALRALKFDLGSEVLQACVHIDNSVGVQMTTHVNDAQSMLCAQQIQTTCDLLGL